MSDYTKTTDFAAKDALITGNPSKVVLGTEIDTEFVNIRTAVNSKLDDVLTTRGDLLYEGASGEARLAVGSEGYILRSDGTDPTWQRPVYGGRAYRGSDASIANATWEGLSYPTEVYDYASCLSNPAGTTVIPVPSGVSLMRVETQIGWEVDSTGDRLARLHTGSTGGAGSALTPTVQMRHSANNASSGTGGIYFMSSGWVTVTPAATYHIDVFHTKSSGALLVLADLTWLSVEFK